MNKKGSMMMIFIGVIIAVIIVGIVFSFTVGTDTQTAIAEDTFTSSNITCVQITNNCIVKGTGVIENASNEAITYAFAECGTANDEDINGYLMTTTNATVENQNNGKTINATYTEISCEALTGMTRTIVQYSPILLAVVILAFLGTYALGKK